MPPANQVSLERVSHRNNGVSTVIPYLLVLFLAIWTARTAMSKGRNPWIWGGAALLLGLLPWKLLAVIPLVLMLFLPRMGARVPVRQERLACPKCAQSLRTDQHFCTSCGWDLSQVYTPDGTEPFAAATMERPQEPPPATQVETKAETPLEAPTERPPETPVEPVLAQTIEVHSGTAEAAADPAAQTPMAEAGTETSPVAGETTNAEEPVPPVADIPPAPTEPWGMPPPRPAPTAAAMTERGNGFFNEGRIQEAIDQFTKAIALDPSFGEAFERRAEAYAKQGRGEQAAEDRRRLQGLNASSSPG